ncbi:unnamed protein product [Echinostoma caproni]|uniref:Uncharacterized protein n=1 Tax=Echinostoma caproni TaxID=27848 RepID=A0A183A0H1_9TREM|nr:unnamed protein product [Echinostoma caproni]
MVLHDQIHHAVKFYVDARIEIEKNNFFAQPQLYHVARRVLCYGAFLINTSEAMKHLKQLRQFYCAMHLDEEIIFSVQRIRNNTNVN